MSPPLRGALDRLRRDIDALPWLDVMTEDGETGGQMVARHAVLDSIDAALGATAPSTPEPALDVERLAKAEDAWNQRPRVRCEATVHHGPGHQTKTHCMVEGDEPHLVHAASYGSYGDFGVWKDDPSQVTPKAPWIKASDAFDPDDDDEDLMREYETEQRRIRESVKRKRLAFIAHEYAALTSEPRAAE